MNNIKIKIKKVLVVQVNVFKLKTMTFIMLKFPNSRGQKGFATEIVHRGKFTRTECLLKIIVVDKN